MNNVFNVPEPLIVSGTDSELKIDESAKKTLNGILEHKASVKNALLFLANELKKRAEHHDDSKLKSPEIEWLIAMDKEPYQPYGSPEYFEKMKRWKKFFKHHYSLNSHHPDHYEFGISEMDILDIVEYCTDIISYCKKLRVSEAIKLIDEQSKRFHIDGELKSIITNTLIRYFSYIGDYPSLQKSTEELKEWSDFLEKNTREEKESNPNC